MGAGSNEQRGKNGSTKLSSILTVQNSKLHIETKNLAKTKVVEDEKIYKIAFRQKLI